MHLSSILLFQVEEGVSPSKTSNVEEDNLDDLISAAMGDLPDEDTQPEENKRSTSTPTKDDGGVDNQDFGGFISMIRDDSEPPPPVQDKKVDDKPRDIPLDRRSGGKVNLRPLFLDTGLDTVEIIEIIPCHAQVMVLLTT
jgi:hypothetical protein